MATDSLGYLWTGTTKGIFRYDGQQLLRYSRSADALGSLRFPIRNILFAKRDGRETVFGCSDNGVFIYVPETDDFIEKVSEIPYSYIVDVEDNGQFLLYDNETRQFMLADSSLTSVGEQIQVDLDGELRLSAALSGGGYALCGNRRVVFISPQMEIMSVYESDEKINDICVTVQQVFIATASGIRVLSMNGGQMPGTQFLDGYAAGKNINFIAVSASGGLFFGITNQGIFRFDRLSSSVYPVASELEGRPLGEDVSLFCIDHDDQLWLRHNAPERFLGMTSLRTSTFFPAMQEMFMSQDEHGTGQIRSVAIDRNSCPYVLTSDGILRYDPDSLSFVPVMSLPDPNSKEIAFDQENRLWVLSSERMSAYTVSDGVPRMLRTFEENGYDLHMYIALKDQIVFSCVNKLVTFDRNLNKTCTPVYAEGKSPIICKSPDGETIDVYTVTNSFASFNPSDGVINERIERRYQGINDIIIDRNGNIWQATSRTGVIRIDKDGRADTLSISSGLPDNTIYALAEDLHGEIWIITTNGLARYNPTKDELINYGEAGEMLHDLQFGRLQKAPDGSVYVFSSRVLLRLDSSRDLIEPMVPATPIIESVVAADNVLYGRPSSVTLGHDDNSFSLKFVSIDLMRSRQLHYEYMLEGHDKNWWPSSDANTAVYGNIPPGRYSFRVRARYDGGEYSRDVVLPVRVRPAYYQTTAFRIFASLILIGMIIGIVRYRMRTRLSMAKYEYEAEKQRMMADLHINLSHTIRTPLSLIKAPFKELTENRQWTENEQGLIDIINKNISNVMELAHQFLDSGKMQTNAIGSGMGDSLCVEMKDMSEIIREIVRLFQPTAKSKKIRLSAVDTDHFLAPVDEDKLVKILYNLLENALKHTPENGEVRIWAEQDTEFVRLSVSDTGSGVDDKLKQKIFDQFFRSDKPRVGHHSYGIGLYYTKQLVQQHKGTISVSDNQPNGSVFTITLPVREESYLPEERKGNFLSVSTSEDYVPEDQVHDRIRLLIVEDNDDLRMYLASSLKERYAVSVAVDGLQATEIVKREGVDIVISDVMMPRMDGYRLCSWIKGNVSFCHIPVILLTARTDTTDKLEGLERGADAYVEKPFEPTILFAAIASILRNRELTQQAILRKISPIQDTRSVQTMAKSLPEEHEMPQMNGKDRHLMEKMFSCLKEHLSDEHYSIGDLCLELGLSQTIFYKKIKALTGMTPNALITHFRFSEVLELMRSGEYNLSEISSMTGFSSIATFSRRFREIYDMSPSEWLKQNKTQPNTNV
ncbi:MAG: response regulator [Bacteroidales bacterium]|nr:response regulator [Bacteroidales bacterium]